MTLRTFLGPAAAPLALVAAVLAAAIGGAMLPLEALHALMREDGPVESATVVLYALGVLVVLMTPTDALRPLDRICLAYLFAACIGREVSVRKHLLNADLGGLCCTSTQTKWIVAVLLALLVAAVVRLGWRCVRAFRDRSRPAATYAVKVTLGTIFAAAVLSQLLDGLPKLLANGAAVPPRTSGVLLALEETMELMVAALIVVAILQASRYRARTTRAQRSAV